MGAQEELESMPAKPIDLNFVGKMSLDPEAFADLKVDEEVRITGTYIVRKVGLQHEKGESPTPFATAQLDHGTAKRS